MADGTAVPTHSIGGRHGLRLASSMDVPEVTPLDMLRWAEASLTAWTEAAEVALAEQTRLYGFGRDYSDATARLNHALDMVDEAREMIETSLQEIHAEAVSA